ncbi:CREB-regulated transcription coactivator 1-like [Pistacia vera]|uniref:CREB-regulated transcription coactivator 1-like n=1 Tax=Pistacia vera TaxID=55513 RepID=UPI001262CAB0|nr:CREB-regulated transcription coactivator 1-like [Pistacia vera]
MSQTLTQTMNPPETHPPPPPLQPPHLRRRNLLSTSVPLPIPTKLTLPQNGTSSPSSFELTSLIKPTSLSYTSLKDLIPCSSVNSPTAGSAANSAYEISIRNRLVKQAAWAYLQPMSSSPGSSAPHFLHRLFTSLSSCLRFINSHIISALSRAIHQFLD